MDAEENEVNKCLLVQDNLRTEKNEVKTTFIIVNNINYSEHYTKFHLITNLEFCSSEVRVPLYSHYSQIHSDTGVVGLIRIA